MIPCHLCIFLDLSNVRSVRCIGVRIFYASGHNLVGFFRIKLLHHAKRCDLALNQGSGHILLWTSARYIACGKKPADRCLTVCVHPVTARRVSSDNIRLGPFDLHILLAWVLS